MANLATHLQHQFTHHAPAGWRVRHEVDLVSRDLRRLLGYRPRVDVLLEREDGSRRLWIEFEISRADPVANHAKFATAHLFAPQPAGEVFLSMVTPHVTGGRRNLAANMVLAMRNQGMAAFQTVLLPHHARAEIKRLNHLPLAALPAEPLDVVAEIGRALAVTEPALADAAGSIYFAGNVIEVLLNAYRWNREMDTEAGRRLWGRRTVTYFVYDPRFGHFAPSKYCAYMPVAVAVPGSGTPAGIPAGMTVARYTQVERDNRIFDGTRARQHLVQNLALQLLPVAARPALSERFGRWLAEREAVINVHPAGAQVIVPPVWF